jgi:hypothetical protein
MVRRWRMKMDFVTNGDQIRLTFATSGIVGAANERVITARLREIDPDEETWGWEGRSPFRWDSYVAYWADADSPAGELLRKLARQMEDYPVLDEQVFAEIELEEAADYWRYCSIRERVDLCRKAGVSPFRARHDDVPVETIQYMHLTY